MKISYVTTYDALDIHNWSGTGFYIAKSLEQQNNYLDYIGQLNVKNKLKLKLKSQFYEKIRKENFAEERDLDTVKNFALQIQDSVKKDSDVLFSPGSIPLSLVESTKPKVFYTDATFAGMVGFYEGFSNYCKETINNGNFLEQHALDSASLVIYSSDWAAKTAIDHYNVSPSKIKVVPFGANLEKSISYDEMKKVVSDRSDKVCNLLFLAVDWKRKGGEMALKIAEKLNTAGVRTILHIAGIKNLSMTKLPDYVINHGFISKSHQQGQSQINKLLASSHFLLLPTIADCTPIVYSEANAFGLPCISTNVGGIPSILKDNINGKLFSIDQKEESYAQYIASIFTNRESYRQLAYSSFNEFKERLNWNVTGRTISALLHEL